MRKKRITFLSNYLAYNNNVMYSLKDSGKVPLPTKMYTKPVDVNQPHLFGSKPSPKAGISYEPLSWADYFDSL
jgi:hypothetical protein